MIEERKAFEKTFILNFDASIYKEEEKLDATAQGGGGMRMMSLLVVAEPIIKCQRKSFTVDKEFMVKSFDKRFTPELQWKVEMETCIIGLQLF
jgi:hypothetical protein